MDNIVNKTKQPKTRFEKIIGKGYGKVAQLARAFG